jgi:hypothetical protein
MINEFAVYYCSVLLSLLASALSTLSFKFEARAPKLSIALMRKAQSLAWYAGWWAGIDSGTNHGVDESLLIATKAGLPTWWWEGVYAQWADQLALAGGKHVVISESWYRTPKPTGSHV